MPIYLRTEEHRNIFCNKMIEILKTRFLQFSNKKEVLRRLPNNSKLNMEILKYLTQSRTEKSLVAGLRKLFDDIYAVTQDEKKDHTGDDKSQSQSQSQSTDILSTTLKEQIDLTFETKFCLYFARLTTQQQQQQEESNIKSELKTILTILLFQVGIFHKIRNNLTDPSTITFAIKCKKLNLIDLSICDEFQQTLFHFSAGLENDNLLNLFLSIDNDTTKYKNILGNTAGHEAMKHGQWSSVKQIALAKMGSKMKNQAKLEEKRIESKRGIAQQFLKQRKIMGFDVQDDVLLEQLLLTVINLIEQRLPVSDDMLLVCWKYEMLKNGNEKKNRLWNVLKTTIKYVLDHSKNKRNWIWYGFSLFGFGFGFGFVVGFCIAILFVDFVLWQCVNLGLSHVFLNQLFGMNW